MTLFCTNVILGNWEEKWQGKKLFWYVSHYCWMDRNSIWQNVFCTALHIMGNEKQTMNVPIFSYPLDHMPSLDASTRVLHTKLQLSHHSEHVTTSEKACFATSNPFVLTNKICLNQPWKTYEGTKFHLLERIQYQSTYFTLNHLYGLERTCRGITKGSYNPIRFSIFSNVPKWVICHSNKMEVCHNIGWKAAVLENIAIQMSQSVREM